MHRGSHPTASAVVERNTSRKGRPRSRGVPSVRQRGRGVEVTMPMRTTAFRSPAPAAKIEA
ncbi:hypothetical protein SLNWT_3777 [Streptomyces albus]|uniref:Uncharacterized protein n=1 Tax=Streptomyces albus (strain ATCC 21838 / DSM 41398 / FERM P-419 / JCM 4703 / NBRC 107858) TaxID=1081613 RepID=A0A0B5ENE4_STRA4|nr:hypothetical protein SLNWT_3777 [Streptomyces albus]AOU78458.1 hypothetical protein SLNHY_3767 [Streptomyces albus]AYN34204.1 hypothetical protein DUI70_3703 [Streptomyces albus]